MKKTTLFLVFLIPVLVFAQHGRYKSAPYDFMWLNVGNPGFSAERPL